MLTDDLHLQQDGGQSAKANCLLAKETRIPNQILPTFPLEYDEMQKDMSGPIPIP
jgi:hypothetical protein